MKVIWISTPSDCEFDLTNAVCRNTDVQLDWYVIYDSLDRNHAFHMSQVTTAANIKITEIGANDLNVIYSLAKEPCDLIVFRHPLWIPNKETFLSIVARFNNAPVIEWTWEWLPNQALNQMPELFFKRIAVSNTEDFKRCQSKYPRKQTLYFPFGVVDRDLVEYQQKEKAEFNLVCDAQPHYACKEYNGVKRDSVDIMVRPVLDKGLALWGNRYSEVTTCDWLYEPDFAPYVQGTYPTVRYPEIYANAKIYLGVSWNAVTGGFSIRLARALSCGMSVIWQQTLGGVNDIPDGEVLKWSQSGAHTEQLVNRLLQNDEERIRMGRYGQQWSVENWEWIKTLKRLAKEIQ